MVAEAYDTSHPSQKSLIPCRLAEEQAMVKYVEFLHRVNFYGTTCDPIHYEWPHFADYPIPLLSTLECMFYVDLNVNPYNIFQMNHPAQKLVDDSEGTHRFFAFFPVSYLLALFRNFRLT